MSITGRTPVHTNSIGPRRSHTEDRIKDIYAQLVSRLPPELRGKAPVLEISRRKYSKTIAHYYKYRRGSKIVEKIRVDPRAVEILSDWEIKHILAHELAHFVLESTGVDRVINSLHLGDFYKILARLAGYKTAKEAWREDYAVRDKYEKLLND